MLDANTFGLTKNESEIYLFLLKRGPSTTGSIIKETGIANSRVYESLNSLIEQGLVTYSVHKDGKRFAASDPNTFLEKVAERERRIREALPHMIALKNTSPAPTTTAIYEGFQGFKAAFTKIIDDCPAGGTIQIIGFSEQAYATKSLRTFLANMNTKSAQKKQRLRILLDTSTRKSLGKDRERERYAEVRYLPSAAISPVAIDIFEDYVYMFLWEEKPFVFMIKNKKITESFKQYHEILWKTSRK